MTPQDRFEKRFRRLARHERRDRIALLNLALAFEDDRNDPQTVVDPESNTSLTFWPIREGAFGMVLRG